MEAFFFEEELVHAWRQGLWYDMSEALLGYLASVRALGVHEAYPVHARDTLKLPDKEGGCPAVEITMDEVHAVPSLREQRTLATDRRRKPT